MAAISSPGIGSGLDINGILSKLMAVESQPLAVLQTKEASYQAQLSAYGSLKGALSSLQTSTLTLKNSSTFTSMLASSSNSSSVSASATTAAAAGNYSVTVGKLANYHSLRSNADYTSKANTFTTGTLSISVSGGTAANITIDSTNNTLAGIMGAINASSAAVTASVINDGGFERLVITSDTLGSDGLISISVADATTGGTFPLSGLDNTGGVDQPSDNPPTHNFTEVQPAQDAELTINGLSITRSSNTISDAIEGVTLSLTSLGTATVSVVKNTSSVQSAVNAFVKAYNDVITQIKSATAYDAENKRASVLTGDSTTRNVQSRLTALVQSNVSGISGGISNLSSIGISVQKDGKLAVDSSKLSAALADSNKDVASLFAQTTSSNEGIAVRFNNMLESIVGTSGLIASRTEGINTSIKSLQSRADAFNLRLVNIERRYRAQFTALDTLVASMNQTSTYLTQQLANLPGASSSSK